MLSIDQRSKNTTTTTENLNVTQTQETESKEPLIVGGFDFTDINKLVSDFTSHVNSIKGKDIVLVIGDIGAGKSTTITYRMGFDFKPQQDGDDYIAIPQGTDGHRIPEIGRTQTSTTFYPEAYECTDGYSDCDFPGFNSTKTNEEKVCESVTSQIAIDCAANIKAVMVVIEKGAFTVGRGDQFRRVSETLMRLLKYANPEVFQSILFVITKAKKNTSVEWIIEKIDGIIKSEERNAKRNENNKEEFEKSKSRLAILNLIKESRDRIIIPNVFKPESRQVFSTKLKELKSISKEMFDFGQYDRTRKQFDEIIANIAYEGTTIIRRLVSIPARIQEVKEDIEDSIEREKFYEKEITHSSKLEQIRLCQARTNKNIQDKNNKIQEINKLTQEMYSLINERKKIVADKTPIIRWQDQTVKSPFFWRFLTFLGSKAIIKDFKHTDSIPYKIENVKEFQEGGEFYGRLVNPERGEYKVSFKPHTTSIKTPFASVQLIDFKCDLPDSIKRIKQIEDRYAEIHNIGENIKKEINDLDSENKLMKELLIKLERDEKLDRVDFGIGKRNIKPVAILNQEIQDLTKVLDEAKKHFQENEKLYNTVWQIGLYLQKNSFILAEFVKQYNQLNKGEELTPDDKYQPSNNYIDIITQNIMKDPVITRCGHSFERLSILKAIETSPGGAACPCCREKINPNELTSNRALKEEIDRFLTGRSKILGAIKHTEKPQSIEQLKDVILKLHEEQTLIESSLEFKKQEIRLLEEKLRNLSNPKLSERSFVSTIGSNSSSSSSSSNSTFTSSNSFLDSTIQSNSTQSSNSRVPRETKGTKPDEVSSQNRQPSFQNRGH